MPQSMIRPMLILYAQSILNLNQIKSQNEAMDRVMTVVNEMGARMETSFDLTSTQKVRSFVGFGGRD